MQIFDTMWEKMFRDGRPNVPKDWKNSMMVRTADGEILLAKYHGVDKYGVYWWKADTAETRFLSNVVAWMRLVPDWSIA